MRKSLPSILLVEDDSDLIEALSRVLTIAGYEVWAAPNGAMAEEMYDQSHPDLVVTDLIMPEKDGIELIVNLRRKDSSARILAISGGAAKITADSQLAIARKLGAQQTLAKPFSNDQLLEAVRLLL
jgi:DNA-binding response OmpR family regulator